MTLSDRFSKPHNTMLRAGEDEEVVGLALMVACIDKWVKSKFEDATPPELCSGPKLAIWYKNQPPGPEKTPGHGEKSKLAILPLFGHAKVLGEKTILEYNNSY